MHIKNTTKLIQLLIISNSQCVKGATQMTYLPPTLRNHKENCSASILLYNITISYYYIILLYNITI